MADGHISVISQSGCADNRYARLRPRDGRRAAQDTLRDCISAPRKLNYRIVYAFLITCRYGKKQLSAFEKFARRGWSFSREQITAAVVRCNEAISSHMSFKCSLEISLASMKSEFHFATYDNRPRLP